MTWSSSAISAAEIAAYQADKPMFLAAQLAYEAQLSDPRWNTTGLGSTADSSAAGYEAWKASDRKADLLTRPSAAGASWFWVADMRASTCVLDTIVILGSNASVLSGGITFTIDLASDAAFSVGFVNVVPAIAISYAGPLVFMLVNRYTATGGAGGYLRVRMQTSPAALPECSEIWVGRRRQLRRSFLRPFGPDHRGQRFEGLGLQGSRTSMFSGRSELGGKIELSDAEPTLLDTTTMRAIWSECGRGAQPMLYWLRPQSAQLDCRLVRMSDPKLSLDRRNVPGSEMVDLRLQELPPYIQASVP